MGKRTKVLRGNIVLKKTTKKQTNYIGEITKQEDTGNQILYFSEIIISMLNIALK